MEKVQNHNRNHHNSKPPHVVIDTNATLLTNEVMELVINNKTHLQISLDGPQEIHDRQRLDSKGNGSYHSIVKAVNSLLKKDPSSCHRLSIICTVAPPTNLQYLDDFFSNFPPYKENGISDPLNLSVNFANLQNQQWPASEDELEVLGNQLKT